MTSGRCAAIENVDIHLLDYAGGGSFWFPVNPPTLDIRGEAILETVEITRLGEVDFFAGNRRTQIEWASFLPGRYDPHYCRYSFGLNPIAARDQITAWRTAGTVLRLIITGTSNSVPVTLVNAPVIISMFSPQYKGGEPQDIYYSIHVRQFREVQIRTAPELVAAGGQAVPPRLDLNPVPGWYTVQPGDTLYLISQKILGFGERWREIYSLNQAVVGDDPTVLKVGLVLVMPGAGLPPPAVAPATPTEETPPSITPGGVPVEELLAPNSSGQ